MQRWTTDNDCFLNVKFEIFSCYSSGVVTDVDVYKTDTSETMEVVFKFVFFPIIILTSISVLTDPNLETCFCLIFITPLLYGRSFFPNITTLVVRG